ncbi:MAG: phytoene/squalene synthase family protein [Fimbriimonas sp.]|nr:phytoene/squalene synthase family protein [Fimbriimonas sp.]
MKDHYSSPQDIELCRKIHKAHGTTYYYSTRRFPASIRWRVHGLYAFVRIADEWVDNPDGIEPCQQRNLIETWRKEMVAGVAGKCPNHPVLRVFCDAFRECDMPIREAHCFLDAMLMDIDRRRYASFNELRHYMRGSASAVGILMCSAMGVTCDEEIVESAKALGEAMQLTNFLRDIGEDYLRGRIYLPQEDMERFGVDELGIAQKCCTPAFKKLMRYEIARARDLYCESDRGIDSLPSQIRRPVLLARTLYAKILDKIEEQGYDVFTQRARTTKCEKIWAAAKVTVRPRQAKIRTSRTEVARPTAPKQ